MPFCPVQLRSPHHGHVFDYLRDFAPELGARIVETYPPLQSSSDPFAAGITTLLLRRPKAAAQALAISAIRALLVGLCDRRRAPSTGRDTAQGNRLGVLYRCSRKLLALTGTLMGGYADDLFNILYRINPAGMVAAGFAVDGGR